MDRQVQDGWWTQTAMVMGCCWLIDDFMTDVDTITVLGRNYLPT